MTNSEFKKIAGSVPKLPGVYKYFSSSGELIYVGKAKNLFKRVSSYFTKKHTGYKTYELVKQIARIEFTIVDTEQDALFLENSLIKQFQPKFNIHLKDDKTYPYIVIKNEPFPRVFLTRKVINDGSEYLGPYTSIKKVRELLEFTRQNIPQRNCALNLSKKNIEGKKFKVCLEYHLGNCKGPCEGLQDESDYNKDLAQLKNLLKGNLQPVIQHFKAEMKDYSVEMNFEKAEIVKNKIAYLKNYQARSVIVNPKLSELDVFSIIREDEAAFVNFLMVRNGTIVQSKTIQPEFHLDETDKEILEFCITRLRESLKSTAKELVLPFQVHFSDPETRITVPKSGDKKKLLDLSVKNASYLIEDLKNKKRLNLLQNKEGDGETLTALKNDLKLQKMPTHIECFDNSNFQGAYPVSAMVCFKNGMPSKKDYRLFNVKTVKGINDFATMKEAVFRRYKRLKEEKQPFPQLIVIDGGKGQLNAAAAAIDELQIKGKITLIGLAKNEEEIFFAEDKQSLILPLNSKSLRLLRLIRDEVHRFGINFHRKKRSKGTFENELENIKGIGTNTAETLLKKFRSIKRIRDLSQEELESVIGKRKTKILIEYFKNF